MRRFCPFPGGLIMDFFPGNDDYEVTAEFMQVTWLGHLAAFSDRENSSSDLEWNSESDTRIRIQVSSKIELLDRVMAKLLHTRSCGDISSTQHVCVRKRCAQIYRARYRQHRQTYRARAYGPSIGVKNLGTEFSLDDFRRLNHSSWRVGRRW